MLGFLSPTFQLFKVEFSTARCKFLAQMVLLDHKVYLGNSILGSSVNDEMLMFDELNKVTGTI